MSADIHDPREKRLFTERWDRVYSAWATVYDIAVKVLPVWRFWIRQAVPHIEGPRVLEVSFGTGWLLTQYAGNFDAWGIDYNARMAEVASANLAKAGIRARLQRASVEALPFADSCFDTVVNTMAFSGYPDGHAALHEIRRVLRPGGRLVLIDVGYPADGNPIGTALARAWESGGDIVRDLEPLFHDAGLPFSHTELGGSGSVHLFIAKKPTGG